MNTEKADVKKDTDIMFRALQEELKANHREQAVKLVREGALEKADRTEKTQICQKIISTRDRQFLEVLAKKLDYFEPEMLLLDFGNWNNREFIRGILSKYKKKFNLENEETCVNLFDIACEVESEEMLIFLIRKNKASSGYSRLAESSDPLFQLVCKIDPSKLEQPQVVDFLVKAVSSQKGAERLKTLYALGFDISARNEEGKTAKEVLADRARQAKNPKGRQGRLNKTRDEAAVQYFEILEREEPEEKSKWKKLLPAAAILLIAVIGIGAAVYYQSSSSDTDGAGTEAESADDGSTESTDTDSTDASYSTDTSLCVEDGDIVNIDYTGYVDGEAFDGGSTGGYGTDLTIGSGMYIDDFEEQLIGHYVGENVTVEVTFPEDYGIEELNGKDAQFEVTINGIYED